ncbi:M15 family metallopeptidase, partial [Ruminococcaceae bacterium OttesenSCG-928-O06]|nr:M15 family metallopeptidase [Ruminococcaceae bacterium OttesenSCG-928-O06]
SQAAARRRRKKARQRQRASLLVLAVLVVILFLVALLFAGGTKPQSSSAPSSVSQPSSSVPVSSAPSVPSRTPTPYDLESLPPLFNFENYIPDEYRTAMEPTLTDIGGGQQMEAAAAAAFLAMHKAAAADGIDLVPVSGFRSNQQQTNNYNASIQRYLNQGYSQQQAVTMTEGYYAIPGTSEHEAGLAIDIGWIEDSFENSDAFAWLQENAVTYGFILRYANDTFDITHIRYEPWHYRFVGANHAEKIVELGITLEEYTALMATT